jgi:hypothetical protein
VKDIFGIIHEHPHFRERFSGALNSIWSKGVEKTLAIYLSI